MTPQWILYAAVCAGLLGAGALAAERVLQLFALPQRWAWLAAIVGSLLLPFALPRLEATARPGAVEPSAAFPLLPAPGTPSASLTPAGTAMDPALRTERLVVGGWLAASLLFGGWLCLSALSLRRARRRWTRQVVDGTPVLVSRGTGPAAVGWLRGEVVLPDWVLGWDEARRRLVVAHEREHLRARDPLLLMAGWISLALVPWCVPLWWQVRRLRLAVEVDCDQRVLQGGRDVRAYGKLLLEVGTRAASGWMPVAAFSESRRTLERRLRMITWRRPPHRGWHAAAAAAATALVPVALFALPAAETPSMKSLATLLESLQAPQEPAVLWITAGDEFRIGRADALVVREEQLEAALSAMRTGDPGTGTIIVRSDSARVAAPGMGYSAIVAGNAACRAGFSVVRYELVKQDAGAAEPRRVGVSERRVARPCGDAGAVDTLPGPRPARAPAPDAAPAPGRAPAASAPRAGATGMDTIPDDRVFIELGRLDRLPAIANARETSALMARIYPEALREAGIGGQVVSRFEVRVDGTVDPATIHISSATDARLAEPTREVVGQLLFRPGELAGEAVRTRVHVPITWTPSVTPAGAAAPAVQPARPTAAAATEEPQAAQLRIRGYNLPAVRPAMADSARGFPRGAAAATRAQPGPDASTGQITGTVRDATGRPLARVAISVPPADVRAITDAAGRYTLHGIPAGTHDVVAVRTGYLASTDRATVLSGQSTTLDITLAIAAMELQGVVAVGYGAVRRDDADGATPQGRAPVAGQVLDMNGRPVVGASVVIPALSIGAVTTDQGRFGLRVPVGTHELHVLAPGAPQAIVRRVSVARSSAPVFLEVTIPPR